MFWAENGRIFLCFIVYISGVNGQQNRICALKGSPVVLPCSAQHHTGSKKWYTVHKNNSKYVQTEISAHGNRVTYISEADPPTLTIKNLREADENSYCCRENADYPADCRSSSIELRVADLQVQVIPATEGQTVTLMCSTSCPLTENPAAYIWYKNREFLYEDWSPWYQELVSSEEAVTYSCAVKGYEDLRAPEVSVDSVTPTCFSVTYAKGRMCSYQQTSIDESCSITYPREVFVKKTLTWTQVTLTCSISCPRTDSHTAYMWYRGGYLHRQIGSQHLTVFGQSDERFACTVPGLKDLLSFCVCIRDEDCWNVNYISRRICALKGSSVNISSEYSHPRNKKPKSKSWYKVETSGEQLIEDADRVVFHDNMKNQHVLTIKNLKKKDSAEYKFRLQGDDEERKQDDVPGVTLVVTDLKVKIAPSAVVTEGQRVSLTCRTSCPLTDNTNYVWFLNGRPLNLTHDQSKHLLLDPVSSQDAGSYSCSVKTHDFGSAPQTLIVISAIEQWISAIAVGVKAVFLVVLVVTALLMTRKKRTSRQSPTSQTSDNTDQDAELHYGTVYFCRNHTDPHYSTVQPDQTREQEHTQYAVVKFRHERSAE